MAGLPEEITSTAGPGAARRVLLLGTAALWLVLTAIVGAIAVGGGGDGDGVATGAGDFGEFDDSGTGTGGLVGEEDAGESGFELGDGATSFDDGTGGDAGDAGIGSVTGSGDASTGGTSTGGGGGGGGGGAPAPQGGGAPQPQQQSPGDRTGVTATQIKIGIHAPITFSGVPLNLAEDPIKGIRTYTRFINERGGINGRKIELDIQDDRFDSEGARRSAQTLINDNKNFMVSGTLGIDQIAIVAAEAARRGVPYTAAGGDEANPIPGMFQLATSYSTHAEQLAAFMAKDSKYRGKRVGILVSDSQYIRPVAEQFKRALEERGQVVSTIVANQKPAQNPDYNGYILRFRQANTEVLVPLTDPLTTQQIVQRCAAGAACGWTYSFSNFAHESDTALALMAPTWGQQQVRGLSADCYYLAPEVENPARCASMKIAREQWVALHGQKDWEENGSGGSDGYQIISFLKGALTAPGKDLTRERFVGALRAYSGYSDLITGPITFEGSRNTMHGATKMAVFEAQSNNKYKMITPGLVDGF